MKHYHIICNDNYMAAGIRAIIENHAPERVTYTISSENDIQETVITTVSTTVIYYLSRHHFFDGLYEKLTFMASLRNVRQQIILCEDFLPILDCLSAHIGKLKVINARLAIDVLGPYVKNVRSNNIRDESWSKPLPFFGLKPRQKEVFHLLAEGRSLSETSKILKIDLRTVSTHKRNVMAMLNMTRQNEYLRFLTLLNGFPSVKNGALSKMIMLSFKS